jgi:hypothetical protein
MKLIIDLISIKQLGMLDAVIFTIGFIITCTYILFKVFSKEELIEEDELDYYSRHKFPIKKQNK